MKCPFCLSPDNGVVDSRETEDGRVTRRRRRCGSCSRRFTTYERIEEVQLFVVKRDKRRQLFDPKKLVSGMLRACEKRPISSASLEAIATLIEKAAADLGEREVSVGWIGEQVMVALKQLDDVAYVRFASVYRCFRDVDEFALELKKIKDENEECTK